MPERVYCSELAKAQEAPVWGTAVHVEAWLLIEYPRPWKPKALQDNDLPAAVKLNLEALPQQALAQGVKLRIQFIKQASSADNVRPRLFFADGRDGQVGLCAGVLDDYRAIANLSFDDLVNHRLPNPRNTNGEIYLVCTNGQRDVCCARFGLPLFEQLRMDYGQRVWQTTHLGGHRYAPNLLCLPSGFVYGFVDPEASCQLVAEHDQGLVRTGLLRGRSAYAPALQAAEAWVRDRFDVPRRSQITCETLSVQDDITHVAYHGAQSGQLQVASQALPQPIIASCGAEPKIDHVFTIAPVA